MRILDRQSQLPPRRLVDRKCLFRPWREHISTIVVANKGRVERAEWTSNVGGSLTIDIANMETTVNVTQKQMTKLKSSDGSLMPTAR